MKKKKMRFKNNTITWLYPTCVQDCTHKKDCAVHAETEKKYNGHAGKIWERPFMPRFSLSANRNPRCLNEYVLKCRSKE